MTTRWNQPAVQRILLVESDPAAAEQLTGMIAGMAGGQAVMRARSGGNASRRVQEGAVSVVLVAERLADMTGRTLIRSLLNGKRPRGKAPACVLLAEGGERDGWPETGGRAAVDVIPRAMGADALIYALDRAMDGDGMNARIRFNRIVQWVLLALIPLAVVLGAVLGGVYG